MIDAQPGQRAYRFSSSSPSRTFYRELEIIRVTPKQIIARTKMRQEVRFWRRNGREVGGLPGAYISLTLPAGDHYFEAGCDKGREWK